jgi:hypothetical protein
MEPVQHHHQRQCLRRAGHWQVAEEPHRYRHQLPTSGGTGGYGGTTALLAMPTIMATVVQQGTAPLMPVMGNATGLRLLGAVAA